MALSPKAQELAAERNHHIASVEQQRESVLRDIAVLGVCSETFQV